ncbi:MAG: S26 family signal peptidase [Bacteroidales bacterium]|nr:S26 family signal peptidase [Bacteroidales bacterium]
MPGDTFLIINSDSYDSRYWGFVPEDHIIGKV